MNNKSNKYHDWFIWRTADNCIGYSTESIEYIMGIGVTMEKILHCIICLVMSTGELVPYGIFCLLSFLFIMIWDINIEGRILIINIYYYFDYSQYLNSFSGYWVESEFCLEKISVFQHTETSNNLFILSASFEKK